jgi:non-heme chloroperoxidase
MSHVTTKDGTKIFYKDWGNGQPIIFSHGWPLSADAWDGQMLFFLNQGYRVIAHDRRGHGRSTQTSENNTMDQYADDLAAVIEHLELNNAILVGHSTGGGEVTRYIGRHGTKRLSKVVLVGAVPPLMLKTEENPEGLPIETFDAIRKSIVENRSQFYRDFTMPFFGYDRPGADASVGNQDAFWLQAMMGGAKSQFDSVQQFSETDFTEDLKRFDIPTLIMHGEDDQIVPIEASARKMAKLLPHAELKVYPGAPHALAQTHQAEFNKDLLAFIESGEQKARKAS